MNRQFINKIITVCMILCLSLPGMCDKGQAADYDLVSLESGAIVEGCITVETKTMITIETIGGAVSMPMRSVAKVSHARPGESELMLGLNLLERRKLDRASRFIKKASLHAEWRDASKSALEQLEKARTSIAEEEKIKEKKRIESLIKNNGLEAGISELERIYKDDNKNNKNDADYWGSVRGNLHLLMARDRIDHLDSKGAERQLLLAEKYGVDPQKWKSVRNELIALRRESVLLGADKLAARRMKKPVDTKYSSFLAVVQKAKKNGEKLPPIHLLQLVDRYAKLNQLDPLLVWAMIDTESSWRVDVVAHDGGQGLMQLMPPTAKELDVSNPLNAEQNIRGGTEYLRFLLSMFKDTDTALAAYNVGPGRVERTGVPPAGKRYIKKVRTRFASLQKRFGISSVS